MASRRFVSPLTATGGGRLYFEQPLPGKVRIIRSVIITSVDNLLADSSLMVSDVLDGLIFAAGPAANLELAVGNFQLTQPIEWRSGEQIWLDPPPSLGSLTPDQALGHAGATTILTSLSMTVGAPVAAGELVVVTVGANVNAGDLTTVVDSKNNSYNQQAHSSSGTVASGVYSSLITTPLAAGDSITMHTSGNGGARWMAAQSFTLADSATGYASTGANGAAGAVSLSTDPINAGDVLIGTAFDGNGSGLGNPAAWTSINTTAANPNGASSYLFSNGPLTYAPGTATGAWAASAVAFRSTPANYNLGIALAGLEYD